MALTKVGPAGIGSTPGTGYVIGDSFLHSTGLNATNAYYTGIVTAQTFRVLGNFQVDGTTTTLDTEVTSVDKLEVAANNTTVGVAITQSGSGDIFNLYDGSSEVFSVADGGAVTATGNITSGGTVAGTTGTFGSSGTCQITNLGNQQWGGIPYTGNIGSFIAVGGQFYGCVSGGGAVFHAYTPGNSTAQATISGNGNATFKGDLTIADKIIHDSDPNTAIRFPAADTFSVETGGNERFRIVSDGGTTASNNIILDADGRLGIGLTNPEDKLHLSDSNHGIGADFTLAKNLIRFEDTDVSQSNNQVTGGILFEGHDTDSNAAGLQAAIICNSASSGGNGGSQLKFYTTTGGSTISGSSSERLRIASDGYIGINDGAPGRILSIKYNDNTAYSTSAYTPAGGVIKIFNESTTAGCTAGEILFGARNSGTGYASITGISPGTQEVELAFRVMDGATFNEALYINKSGVKQIKNGNLNIQSTYIDFSGDQSSTPQTAAALYRPADGTFAISTQNNERLRITSAGNVGIGTNNPLGKLVVSDGANGLEFNPNSNNAIVSYNRTTSAYAPNGLQGSTVQLRIGGVGTALHVHSNGNVGINETSPDTKLHVRNDNSAALKVGGQGSGEYYLEIGQLSTSGSPGFNATGNNTSMLFRINGTEAMRVDPSGDVGIGDNTPDSNYGTNLSVHSTATDGARLKLSDGTTGKGNLDGLDIISTGGVAYFINRESADMYFGNSGGERIRIKSNGTIQFTPEGATSNPNGSFDTSGDNFRINAKKDGSGGCGFIVQTQNGGALGERLRIGSNGQIGMGKAGTVTVNGNSPLTIQESDSNSETICLRATNSGGNGSQAGIVFKKSDSTHLGAFYADVNSESFRLSTNGAGNTRIVVDKFGNAILNGGLASTTPVTSTTGNPTIKVRGKTVSGSSTTVDLNITAADSTSGTGIEIQESSNSANALATLVFNHGSLKAMIGCSRVATNNWGTDLRFYTHPDSTDSSNQHKVYERFRIKENGELQQAYDTTYRQQGYFRTNTSVQNNSNAPTLATQLSYGFGYQDGFSSSSGGWSFPYPKLILGYHTGINLGGHRNYYGCRFFEDHPSNSSSVVLSVGNQSTGVHVTNTLTAGTKTFRIVHPHPSKKYTHDLVHSVIEGPQCDNIYRGKVDLVNGTASINIDTVSNMTDGTFVLLNRDVQCFTSNETGWTAVKGSVSGNILTITAKSSSCTDTISWMVIGERQDDKIKSPEIDVTDSDGKLIIEPLTIEQTHM